MLEFLPELFDTLRDEGYSLTESEAAVFLPCLVEKVYLNSDVVNFDGCCCFVFERFRF